VTRVKVCCIASPEEAALAIRLGAHAVGLVSAMPSGPGPIPEPLIAEIAARVPPPTRTFLLTSLQSAREIAVQHAHLRTTTIQIVDHLLEGTYEEIRAARPGVELVQVIHVNDEGAVREALAAAPHVDALLLDSGNQKAAVKVLGGTGRTHDWSLSRRIVAEAGVPVYLAGGLRADNAAAAIAAVRPFALDLCSGVRTDGKLDEAKLTAFMHAVREAA
jgi:phosphoribosylanthranilate isomerase